MAKKSDPDVGAYFFSFFIFVVVLVALVQIIPKPFWIGLGVAVGVTVLLWLIVIVSSTVGDRKTAAPKRARPKASRAPQARAEAVRKANQRLVETLGEKNADLIQSARAAVTRVDASEAARAGWLGDVDFAADIQAIAEKFEKAHALRQVTRDLSALDKPSADDRIILAEANATIAKLEFTAMERVELIQKCASEAHLIDESLHTERADAETAEQRAQLHAKLSAMLYGIEATPELPSNDSAADAVMARVQAYREIKREIQRARDAG
jgi:hypothetical protein